MLTVNQEKIRKRVQQLIADGYCIIDRKSLILTKKGVACLMAADITIRKPVSAKKKLI